VVVTERAVVGATAFGGFAVRVVCVRVVWWVVVVVV
jgi:hypothetical protein